MNARGGWSAALVVGAVGALSAPAAAQLDEVIGEQLSLEHFSVQHINVPNQMEQYHEFDLVIDGQPTTLMLLRHSNRGPQFEVLTPGEDNVLSPVAPPPVHTYKGMLRGMRGSRVAASLHGGQLHAWIRIGDEIWAVQPATDADPNADPSMHVVYADDDLLPVEGICGVIEPGVNEVADLGTSPTGGGGDKTCEMAWDADYEYYQSNGFSVPNTIIDIENILNACENIYVAEVGVDFELTTVIVRDNVNDPYTTADPSGLLNQFQQEWLNNQDGVHRDLAHLMTGKNLVGSVIGIAYQPGLCSLFSGYALSQSKFSNNFAFRTSLTAHEIGHNWNAGHCDGDGDCGIMCSAVGSCPGPLLQFGVASEASILVFKENAQCLDDVITSTATWTATIDTPNGDKSVDFGDEATITLAIDFDPDIDGVEYLGLAATIFDVLGDSGAANGHVTGWEVLNNLADLTGDFTTTDGVSLFDINAGQLTGFGPFTDDDPIDVFEFSWTADLNETYIVNYDTVTEAMFVWIPGDGPDEAVEFATIEVNAQFANLEGDACIPDCNGDGNLDILDFVCFQGLFVAGDPGADCNGDGNLDILDFVCFQGLFVQGC